MDHDSVNASHVVTPFRKGVSQPPYFVAATPQALAPSMYTRSARPQWDMSIVLYSAGSLNNRRKKCPGRLDKASVPGYTRNRFGALPPRRSAPVGLDSYVTMLTARVPAGRLTRCRSKNENADDYNQPDNDLTDNRYNLHFVHVVTPFRKGVSQPPYFVAAIPQVLAPSMVYALRPSRMGHVHCTVFGRICQ